MNYADWENVHTVFQGRLAADIERRIARNTKGHPTMTHDTTHDTTGAPLDGHTPGVGAHVTIHAFSGNNPERGRPWRCRVIEHGPGPDQITLCRLQDDTADCFVTCRGEWSE